MINVSVNGDNKQFENGTTVDQMLDMLEIKRQRLAVEYNKEILPRTEYAETLLKEGDSFEIVSLVGGG